MGVPRITGDICTLGWRDGDRVIPHQQTGSMKTRDLHSRPHDRLVTSLGAVSSVSELLEIHGRNRSSQRQLGEVDNEFEVLAPREILAGVFKVECLSKAFDEILQLVERRFAG